MPKWSLKECWGERGFPFPQPQTHFSKWSLHLPLLLSRAPRAGAGLAGPGFPGAWLWLLRCLARRAQFSFFSGFRVPLAAWGSGPPAYWVCLSSCVPESLSLVFWVPVSLSLSVSSPLFSLSVLTEVRKCRQMCQTPLPPKKPLPRCFLHVLKWSAEGREGGFPSVFLRTGTYAVDTAHPHPQLPVPPVHLPGSEGLLT